MKKSGFISVFVGSFLTGLVGMFMDIVYTIEADGVLNEGLYSRYYEIVNPFWALAIRPSRDYWYSVWPEKLLQSSYGTAIYILYWALFGLVVFLFVSFIWSKLRSGAKAK